MDYTAIDVNHLSPGSTIKRQLRALFLKNLSLQVRSFLPKLNQQLQYKKTNVFLFLLPAIVVLIVGLMAWMFRLSSQSDDNSIVRSDLSNLIDRISGLPKLMPAILMETGIGRIS